MKEKESHKVKGSTQKKILSFTAKEDTKLLEFLMVQLKDKSRTTVKSFLSHKQVAVDQKVTTKYDYEVKKGSIVTIATGKQEAPKESSGLTILFEDENIVVINKEAGLLTIANDKEKIKTAYSILSKHVKTQHPKNLIFIVHRLDRETSGVMIFAKNEKTQSLLQKDWNQTILQRTYSAIVEGVMVRNEGRIVSWLNENKSLQMYSSLKPGDGQEAITNFKVIKTYNTFTLVEFNLETGRKNQIRVHAKDIGHPIVGDKKYGAKTNPIGRIALHAKTLEFDHPITGKRMKFDLPLPKKISGLLHKYKNFN